MKIRILLPILGLTVLASTLTVNAGGAFLSPRAAGNQINPAAGIAHDPNLINTTGIVMVTPRAAGNQVAAAAGTTTETTPAMACARTMTGNPKTIQACAEHPATMPGCNPATVAVLK